MFVHVRACACACLCVRVRVCASVRVRTLLRVSRMYCRTRVSTRTHICWIAHTFLFIPFIRSLPSPPLLLEYVARATDPSTGEQQIFDATRTKFRPAMRFQVDNDTSVIPGMHQGVVGMCAGEKRNLVIPSRLAYAGDGAGSMIKPHGEGRERGRIVCVCVCVCV